MLPGGEAKLSSSPSASNDNHNSLDEPATRLKAKIQAFSYQPPTKTGPGTNIMPTTRSGRVAVHAVASSESRPRKRSNSNLRDESSELTKAKRKRTTTKERATADPYHPENNLVDSLQPNLKLVIIGLNPGLTTAKTGHAYAHPSNLFWKILYLSGITSIRHRPEDTHSLMELYSVGNTNICQRATRSGDGLSKDELAAGALTLEAKIIRFRPEAVCIVGKSIWEAIYRVKTAKGLTKSNFNYGWQDEQYWLGRLVDDDGEVEWTGARTFVATTTSGLAAGMSTQQKVDIWTPLGVWLQERNGNIESNPVVKAELECDRKYGVKLEDQN